MRLKNSLNFCVSILIFLVLVGIGFIYTIRFGFVFSSEYLFYSICPESTTVTDFEMNILNCSSHDIFEGYQVIATISPEVTDENVKYNHEKMVPNIIETSFTNLRFIHISCTRNFFYVSPLFVPSERS